MIDMQKIRTDIPLNVWKVTFKDDREPLLSRVVFITERFLIVLDDENKEDPTFYNLDIVETLEDVRPEQTQKPEQKTGGNVWLV